MTEEFDELVQIMTELRELSSQVINLERSEADHYHGLFIEGYVLLTEVEKFMLRIPIHLMDKELLTKIREYVK